VFGCANQESVGWLISLSSVIIRVEDAECGANQHHWMLVHMEEADLTAEEIVKLEQAKHRSGR